MASAELRKFLEDRLLTLDPSLDISSGSPAQTKFVEPILTYLGSDPFETDIDQFIMGRFQQEYPDLYAADPGALRDLLIKPLRIILEPFKREIESIRRGQSLSDPSLLSDEDADALIANIFDSRDEGGYAVGQVRLYFPNPTDIRLDSSAKVFSNEGLNYFPTNPVAIAAELMAFNREGTLFYLDVPVRAEAAGVDYNIDAGVIAGIEGVPNVVRATNLRAFVGGAVRQDNVAFVAAAETSLTERSLANRRGTIARLNSIFKGQLRSVQVIGAKDPEMQRDILGADSPGHAWITGTVEFYKGLAYVRARTIEGSSSQTPTPGDTLYIYVYDSQALSNLPQSNRFIRLKVEELLFAQALTADFQYGYLVRWSDAFGNLARIMGDGLTPFMDGLPTSYEGGFAKKGTVKISSLPDITVQEAFDVPNNEVHVFGRSDVYVRPTTQSATKVVLDGIYDLGKGGHSTANPHYFVENLHLSTVANSNFVSDQDGYDFLFNGVEPGDLISLEDGSDAGLYVVGAVSSDGLYLNRKLSATATARYRVMKNIRINPFEPRISKFPFGDVEQRDLNTSIGQTLVTFSVNDLLSFGAKVGDTLRILEGGDAGDYQITAFDQTLGGKGIYLDRALGSGASNLPFEVFTPLSPVLRPLVRLRELLLLDSAKQSTGLTIPPADPVAVVPTSDFTSAKVLGQSQLPSGYVLPDLADLLVYEDGTPLSSHAATSGGRYSSGIDTSDGTYISLVFPDNSQAELDLRSDSSGRTSFFVATTESFNDPINYPPIAPKAGECLTIKTGPNAGSYLIRAVHKFKYRTASTTAYVYFVQIYGQFPVDPLKQIITFLKEHGQASGLEVPSSAFPLQFPSFFSTFFSGLGEKLASALGIDPLNPPSEAQAIVEAMAACSYEWGVPARGVLRTYLREPTLFEQYTADAEKATTYAFKTPTAEMVRFRPDPSRYQKQELLPARLSSDADPVEYPRDLAALAQLPMTSTATAFSVGAYAMGAGSKNFGLVEAIELDGSLILSNVSGDFIVGETVTDDKGGSGVVGATMLWPSEVLFKDPTRPSVFSYGIADNDIISIHEEITNLTGTKMVPLLGASTAGSQHLSVVDYGDPVGPFLSSHTGSLLFIEEGDDAGGYRVTKVVDGWTVTLDRALVTTTSPATKSGGLGSCYFDGTDDVVQVGSGSTWFGTEDVGSYLTLFGLYYQWWGSFKILSVALDGSSCTVQTPSGTHLPPFPVDDINWAVTAAPDTEPAQIARGDCPAASAPTGTSLLAGHMFRIYESVPREVRVTAVKKSVDSSGCDTEDIIADGFKQPFRIFRPDVRRITPTEMDGQRDGFLAYFDTEVVSLSPSSTANISASAYLTVDDGTFWSIGYRHIVADPSFSYSTQELGYLDLPPFLLPVGSADSADNLVRVVGSPLQITYEMADLVAWVQSFVDSASDRLIGASLLARHFLPAYVSYDATYVGGSDPAAIAKDIRDKIDQTPIETSVDVSEVERLIENRGGNPRTPTKLSATVYDWNRRMWVEFSEDAIDGAGSLSKTVPYHGSPRVTAFMPGQDASGLETIPVGERINLKRG